MPASPQDAATKASAEGDIASYLDMPADRRALAKAHAAMLSVTAGKVALELPMGAGVDDFRRVLAAEAKP